jgi:predicted ATPase
MNRIIITGGPGFGKSSIIHELEAQQYEVFHEFSREIIAEQKKLNGDIVPWKDHHAFNEAVFKGRLAQYHAATHANRLYFFDRGLPDSLAYLLADEKEVPDDFLQETKLCSYYHTVFITAPWEEIYMKDDQRWEGFDYALKIHDNIVKYYTELNYNLVEVPQTDVKGRVEFILQALKKDFAEYLHSF